MFAGRMACRLERISKIWYCCLTEVPIADAPSFGSACLAMVLWPCGVKGIQGAEFWLPVTAYGSGGLYDMVSPGCRMMASGDCSAFPHASTFAHAHGLDALTLHTAGRCQLQYPREGVPIGTRISTHPILQCSQHYAHHHNTAILLANTAH